MKSRLLELLACPECGTSFQLHRLDNVYGDEIHTGLLECQNAHLYPVYRRIPRLFPGALHHTKVLLEPFFSKATEALQARVAAAEPNADFQRRFAATQGSFSSEWQVVGEHGHAWGLEPERRRDLFLACFGGMRLADLAGKVILDAGCGHGEVEIALANAGCEIVAVDLSFSVDAIQARLDAEAPKAPVHLVQGSIGALPFPQRAFHLVHSAGVLHHTPDTRTSFGAVSARVAPGGAFFVELYSAERKNPIAHRVTMGLRGITWRIPHSLLHRLCFIGAPFLWAFTRTFDALTRRGVYRERSLRECELSLFDAFSPQFAYHHTTPEVQGWFRDLGYADVRETFRNKNGFGFVGTLPR
jgi:2-polyprenyl-3-methyl-5-hydroxy-6-metoxy-1,4-benzoquinol methylase/uncharacterized protein YbaR (Trm112 family)